MTRKIKRGMSGESFTVDDLDVMGEALDEFQQTRRYAAGLSSGDDRREKNRRAQIADRLLERVHVEERKRTHE